MNFGHTSVTVDIVFNTKCPNKNFSYFYDFLGVVLWALIV
jgi:hypothetical protein